MARRNLLAEAQVTAAAEVAPQIAALSEALQQARSDRNAAIHTAAAASRGLGRAINRAGGTLKRAYGDSARLAAPGQSYAGAAHGAAAANERAVTGTVLASSLANSLKELSDRRIEAAAGRAYRTQAAEGAYQANVGKVQSKRQALAQQQGLLTGAAFSKLTEAQADRDFQASQQASQQQFTAGQNLLGRKNDRIVAAKGQQFQAAQQDDQQSFTAGQNAADRAIAKAQKAATPPSASSIAGRTKIQALTDIYNNVGKGSYSPEKGVTLKSMTDVHRYAQSKGYPDAVVLAASNLATRGYVAPREVQALTALGVELPKQWKGVQVRPHIRKRRSK